MNLENDVKASVHDFWQEAACGEESYLPAETAAGYALQAAIRYGTEPYILPFADFASSDGKEVLEIGVGLGADHQRFAEARARLSGIDLTARAVEHTRRRLALFGLTSDLRTGDAENLPYPDGRFDLVYAWGVIHHTPDPSRAAREILRVLKPGGRYAVMVYHRWSIVGLMLWLRYGLPGGKSLSQVYAAHLESPGTSAFSREEAKAMFPGASVRTELSTGDLLEAVAGQQHRGRILSLARAIWPRRFIRRYCRNFGLFMLIEGRKPFDQSGIEGVRAGRTSAASRPV